MSYFLAVLPILIVLCLMLFFRWSGQRAGLAGWASGLLVAAIGFGLNFDVLWVSQLKGLLLSVYVLLVLWPGLLLYHSVDQAGGIRAMALLLEKAICDRGILLLALAWAFSGMLEGLAGFGVPVAIVAPMLAGLGVAPVTAVAAVAMGHAWSVTFGDMGVVFQTLIAVVGIDGPLLVPAAGLLLGIACFLCGMAAAHVLGQGRRWFIVILLSVLMGVTQYVLAVAGVAPLAAFGAGLVGLVGGFLLSIRKERPTEASEPQSGRALAAVALSYGTLTVLMTLIAVIGPLNAALSQVLWRMNFPEVVTAAGYITPAGPGTTFRFLTHPGSAILFTILATYGIARRFGLTPPGSLKRAAVATWRGAAPVSAGIIFMIGLSSIMEHSGMSLRLAEGLSLALGQTYPLVSPLVGMLGAFATGSNNNSNVLFGMLQKNAAIFLALDPRLLVSAQTAGGSLGSMVAPAKIIVGCTTTGLKGREGEVLKIVLIYSAVIAFIMGAVVLILSNW